MTNLINIMNKYLQLSVANPKVIGKSFGEQANQFLLTMKENPFPLGMETIKEQCPIYLTGD